MSEKPYQIVRQEVEQLEEEIKDHRKKLIRRAVVAVILVLLVFGILYLLYELRGYDDYKILENYERKDSFGTSFLSFNGNIIKYGNDGIFYIDEKNQQLWNQTYEMQSPMIASCEEYLAVADEKGERVYIMNVSGPCGEIETSHPIYRIDVASQGTVAVLMEEGETGYLQIYDKEGNYLAGGEFHARNTGYPMDLAISNDGKKLALLLFEVKDGAICSTVSFYNFGSVGQNEIDNKVSSYSYEERVMGSVAFLTNDIAVAAGDSGIVLYEGKQKPEEKKDITVSDEIESIFWNESYVGVVLGAQDEDNAYQIDLYTIHGSKVRTIDFSMKYEEISFLDNNEICIHNSRECLIYTVHGIERFCGTFEKDLCSVIRLGARRYLFLVDGETQEVKLK